MVDDDENAHVELDSIREITSDIVRKSKKQSDRPESVRLLEIALGTIGFTSDDAKRYIDQRLDLEREKVEIAKRKVAVNESMARVASDSVKLERLRLSFEKEQAKARDARRARKQRNKEWRAIVKTVDKIAQLGGHLILTALPSSTSLVLGHLGYLSNQLAAFGAVTSLLIIVIVNLLRFKPRNL